MTLPTCRSYNPKSEQANCIHIDLDHVELWFSYHTLVAFRIIGEQLVVRENNWGITTGRHLNWIDGGSDEARRNRLDSASFEKAFLKTVNIGAT